MFDEVVEWEERASADVDASLRLLADEEREARRLANEATRRLGALGVLRREQGDELTKIEKESARRRRASVVAAFGCTLGIVPHMAAAILGLAALLHTSALAFETLKWLGVAYLLYMAWSALREQGALRVEIGRAHV